MFAAFFGHPVAVDNIFSIGFNNLLRADDVCSNDRYLQGISNASVRNADLNSRKPFHLFFIFLRRKKMAVVLCPVSALFSSFAEVEWFSDRF
jgi:hypothetical protein